MAEFSPVRRESGVTNIDIYEWQDTAGDNTLAVATDTIATGGLNVGVYREFNVHLEETGAGTYAVEWHGTNDPDEGTASYVALTDSVSGAAISQTADILDEVLQTPLFLRPSLATTTSGIVVLRVKCIR